jgi:Ni/Fe-hydrogenase 1 B-type cytochrome subunit
MSQAAFREAHPLPYVLVHWAHLVSMLALVATGFFIHYPFLPLQMGVVREVHFTFAYIVLVALAVRVWYAFAGRSAILKRSRATQRDVANFLPQRENRGQLLETVRYYLFRRPTHPRTGKYNPLQKTAYLVMGGLLLVQGYTGFALYGPVQSGGYGVLFGFGTDLLGGLTGMRMLHYFVMWAFIALALVHLYLSVAEDAVSIPLMFIWRETLPAEGPAVTEEPPRIAPPSPAVEAPQSADEHEQLTLDLPSDAS